MRRTIVLAAILVLGHTGAFAAPETRLSLLSSSSREIRFRAEFSAPLREQSAAGERLVWPDLGVDGIPGQPGIPTLCVRVALPPDGAVDFESTPEPLGRMGGVTFPVLSPLVEPKSSGLVRPDPVLGSQSDAAPVTEYRSPPRVTLESIGWERGLRIANFTLRPVSWNSTTKEAEWCKALDVTLRIRSAGNEPRRMRGRPDRVGMAEWKHTLINPEDAVLFRVGSADTIPACAGVPPTWFGASESWLRIEIDRNGVYGLTRPALESAGLPVASLDPRTFRLYSGPLYPDLPWTSMGWLGASCASIVPQPAWKHVYEKKAFCEGMGDSSDFQEIALWVKGEGDGTFDSGDAVVFYALGPDNYRDRFGLPPGGEAWFMNPYSDRVVYWLTWDSTLPGSARRMEDVDATPVPGDPEAEQTTGRVHAEGNTFEDPSLYQRGLRWERWYWERMTSDGGVVRKFISLSQWVPGTTIDAVVRYWGAKAPTNSDIFSEAVLHHVQVAVNQVNAGLEVFGGRQPRESFTAHDDTISAMPGRAQTEFTFLLPEVASSDPNRLDWVHLAWIDVTYRRALNLSGVPGEMEIEAGDRRTLHLTGLPSGTPMLIDVSDFRNARRLSGTPSGTEMRVSWNRNMTGVLAVAQDNAWLAPAAMSLDHRPLAWLRDLSEPLDYVIITDEGWMNEAELLAEWRRQHLYGITDTTSGQPPREARVRVVSVKDIMDEFAWGLWDPAALRYFLEYVYLFYGGAGDERLSYCLFLGDTTSDPRNHGGAGSRDYVPSWEDNRDDILNIGFGNVQYVSDDALARFDEPDPCPDELTDLYLGRLPVASRAEVRDLIQKKIIQSEDAPVYGPWRTKAILVADDVCQNGHGDTNQHMYQMENISTVIPRVFQIEKVYLYEYGSDCSIITKPEAKAALLAAWSDGAWLVDYAGHGADVVWADEHVLDLNDTPLLTNLNKYPVVGSFSCSVGKFSNPVRDGLGEAHVRSLQGGSLVSAAATHLTSAASNHAFNLEFVQNLFSNGTDQPTAIGVALMRAKRRRPLEADKYVCLGDPASRLSVPAESLTLEGPSRLDRGESVEIVARTDGGGIRTGTMHVEARDASLVKTQPLTYKMPGAVLYRGQATVEADTARAGFVVPISLRGGPDGRIAAYMSGADWDATGALVPLPVGGLASTGSDTIGPAITIGLTTPEVDAGASVDVTLEDPSGINLTRLFEFRSILLKVTDRQGLEQLREDLTEAFAYDVGSHTRGVLQFRVPDLAPGAYTFTVSATDNFNNRSQTEASAEVGNADTQIVFEGTPLAYPNPFDPDGEPTKLLFSLNRSADVSIRVYTVSGRLVRRAELSAAAGPNAYSWDGRDEAGDPVANGVYLFRVQAERDGSEAAHVLERVVVLR
ncbi:MAG TPA: C25 family cysteine peptidase [Candidatus Eisenbacteria bacterium]|nr:C25 family cysteine peptidase [Candidatus Eisenbacteria bacterium]